MSLIYEKYREDLMNTGVIAALVGGFALTNSWSLDISRRTKTEDTEDTEDVRNIELWAYGLAIIAVHGCTFSAVVSAFLYKELTGIKSLKHGEELIKENTSLFTVPWIMFLIGTTSYFFSVLLVAIIELQDRIAAMAITTFVGGGGFLYVVILYFSIRNKSEVNAKKTFKKATTKKDEAEKKDDLNNATTITENKAETGKKPAYIGLIKQANNICTCDESDKFYIKNEEDLQ